MIGAILCNAGAVTVPLSKGYVALVDLDDLHLIGTGPWHAKHKGDGKMYAAQSRRVGKHILMHRLIIGAGNPDFEGATDHKNGDSLDNRRENLRPATLSQNSMNTIKKAQPNRHGYRGVQQSPKAVNRQFYARVKVEGAYFFSEHFATPEEAARAYDLLAIKHHGEFAVLNFPEDRS